MIRFVLSIALAGIVFPITAGAATLYLDPDTGAYGVGDTFIVNVRLNNDGECINAIQTEVSYPTASLRAVDFSKGGSILNLWIGDPVLDTQKGIVSFMGGVPGGYCGRIQGDPALSNIVGKIIFTVIGAEHKTATIRLAPGSLLYLNDGLGTKASVALRDATIDIDPSIPISENPWLKAVGEDTIPPEAFVIQVESTRGVFGGKYYAVFSTVDKQSGLDHFEIFERGSWIRTTSPHELLNQSLRGGIQIKAIDKAGNERLGTYTEGQAPPRQYSLSDYTFPLFALAVLLIAGFVRIIAWLHSRRVDKNVVDLRS